MLTLHTSLTYYSATHGHSSLALLLVFCLVVRVEISVQCVRVCVCVPGQEMLSAHAAYITHLLFSYAWSQLTCLAIGVLLVLVLVVRVETSVQRVCVCVCVCVSAWEMLSAHAAYITLYLLFSYAWSQLTCLAIDVLFILIVDGIAKNILSEIRSPLHLTLRNPTAPQLWCGQDNLT